MEMVRRQLQEADQNCHELEELHHTLCVEAEQRSNAILEIQNKLAQSQGDLNDINALLHEVNDGLKKSQEQEQALLSLGSDQAVEEAMVANILTAVQQRVVAGAANGAKQAGGHSTSNPSAGMAQATQALGDSAGHSADSKSRGRVKGPSTLEVNYYRSSAQAPETALFKVVRNYTFEQLFEDCCRYWDLFPPDIRIVNENESKWSLEALVEQEWITTRGDMIINLKHIDEGDDSSSGGEEDAGLDDDADDAIGQIDLRKQWPPPINRAKLIRELFLYLGFCAVYVAFIGSQRVTEDAFNLSHAMSETFVSGNFGEFNALTFNDVRLQSELEDFIRSVVVDALFEETYINGVGKPLNEKGFVLRYNKVIGGVQFKQHRVREQTCSSGHRETQYNISNPVIKKRLVDECYRAFSSSTESRSAFGPSGVDGFAYWANPAGESTTGTYGTYPSGGFIRNITYTPLKPSDDFTAEVNQLLSNGWLDENTRAVIIQFVLYNANFHSHVQVKFVIEQTPAGEYQPSGAYVNVFRIFTLRFKPSLEIITFFIIVGYLCYYTFTEIQQAQHCKRVTGSYAPYLKDIWNIIEIFIIWSTCAVVGLFVWLFTDSTATGWKYFRDTYPELGNYVYIQQRLFDLFAVNIFLLVFKLFKYFPLNEELNMLWEMLKLAASSLANFLMMLGVLFVGFVVMANMIFGTQLQEFTTLDKGFINLYLYLLGEFDYDGLSQTDPTWGPVFFSVYMVLFVMIMLNVFLAILNDAYVLVHDRIEAEKIARKSAKKRNWQDYIKLLQRSFAINKRKRKSD